MFSCPKCHWVIVVPRNQARPKPKRHDEWHGLLDELPEHRIDVTPSSPKANDEHKGIEWELGDHDFDSFLDNAAQPAATAPQDEDDDRPLDWDEEGDDGDPLASDRLAGKEERRVAPPSKPQDDDAPLDFDEGGDEADPLASDPLAGVVPPQFATPSPSAAGRDSANDSGDHLWDEASADAGRRSPLDAAPPPKPKPSAPQLDENEEFGVTCPLCGTRSYATLRQVGQTIQCPDCHSKFPVPPPKNPPRQKAARPMVGGAEFKLSETFERPVYQPLVKPLPPPDELEEDEDWWPRRKKRTGEGADGGDAGADPLGTAGDFFAFLPRPDAIMIGVCIFVGLLACTSFLTFATHPGDLGLFAVLFGMILFGVSACYVLVLVAKTAIGIVKETANGAREIDEWPNWNVIEWIGEAGAGIVSLLVSTGPAALMMQLVCFLFMPWPIAVACALFVTAMTHPFILLSILETGSIFSPISTNVARRLTKLPGIILMAYVGAVGLGFLCGIELLLLAWGGYWGMIPLSALWVFTFYMYCRLVGLVGYHLRIGSEEEEYV